MKNRQIIALISSIFFFDILIFSLPARGNIEKKFTKYGVTITNTETGHTMFEAQECLSKNLKTIEIQGGPLSEFYCIVSRTSNEHGFIYKVDIKTGILTIYVGNNSDVIIDYPNKKRQYGTLHPYYISNEKIPIFMILRDINPITIPKY